MDNYINLKYWKEDNTVQNPIYATEGSACMDVKAWKIEKQGPLVTVHTGLHFAVPEGWEMQLRPRSGLTKYRYIIINTPGIIDSDYRGEVLVKFTKIDGGYADDFPYKEGERCAQFNLHRVPTILLKEVTNKEDLGITKRGDGGYSSTGK